jgi:hypothetical protein
MAVNLEGNEASRGMSNRPGDTVYNWNGEPLIAVFFIALEQPMAVPDGTGLFVTRLYEPIEWVQWNEGHNFVGIKLHRTPIIEMYQTQLDDAAMDVFKRATNWQACPDSQTINWGASLPPQANILATVAEVATPLLPTEDGDMDHAFSDAFDRCLEELRRLMRAYFAVTRDLRFRPISRQTCRPMVPFTTQGVDGTWGQLGVFMVHEGASMLPGAPDELSEQQTHALRGCLRRSHRARRATIRRVMAR